MGKSLTRKIIESHFVSGDMTPGKEIFIKVDQTLTHDINAVMTYLAFEAIGLDRRGRGSVRKDRGSLRILLPDREARGARGGSSARGKDADGVAKAGSGGSWAVGIKLGEKNKKFISESAETKMSTLELKDSKIGI